MAAPARNRSGTGYRGWNARRRPVPPGLSDRQATGDLRAVCAYSSHRAGKRGSRRISAFLVLLVCMACSGGNTPAAIEPAAATRPADTQAPAQPPALDPAITPAAHTATSPATATATSTASATATAAATPTRTPASDLEQAVDEYLSELVAGGQFIGVVFIARGGEILVSRGYGMSNYELSIANHPGIKFRLASLTKAFTAMSVLLLHQDGRIDIEDTIDQYVDGFWYGDQVTIDHLLSHRSGIAPRSHEGEDPQTFAELIDLVRMQPLMSQPGESEHYLNDGYRLLGYLVEVVSGQTFDEFVQGRIFAPLGMFHSGYDHNETGQADRAVGYKRISTGQETPANDVDMQIIHAAGALYSTAGDMYLWDQALYSDRLIGSDLRSQMFSRGYGWFRTQSFGQEVENSRILYHSGRLPGFRNYFVRFPQQDAMILVLSNYAGTDAGEIARQLATLLFAEP